MFLYSYLYYELSRPPKERIEGLAKKLFHFLINTEPNEIRFNLLSALEYAADLNSQNPTVISISEICHLEEKLFASLHLSKKNYLVKIITQSIIYEKN